MCYYVFNKKNMSSMRKIRRKEKKLHFVPADAFTAFHKGGDKNGDKMEYRPYEQIIFFK